MGSAVKSPPPATRQNTSALRIPAGEVIVASMARGTPRFCTLVNGAWSWRDVLLGVAVPQRAGPATLEPADSRQNCRVRTVTWSWLSPLFPFSPAHTLCHSPEAVQD